MFNNTKKQKQINKLATQVDSLKIEVDGGMFGYGLTGKVRDLEQLLESRTKELERQSKRLSVLEEIIRESGLITDYTPDEVKIRKDRTHDGWLGYTEKNVAYQINQVKTV